MASSPAKRNFSGCSPCCRGKTSDLQEEKRFPVLIDGEFQNPFRIQVEDEIYPVFHIEEPLFRFGIDIEALVIPKLQAFQMVFLDSEFHDQLLIVNLQPSNWHLNPALDPP